MVVLKFGGSSVKNPEALKKVASIVKEHTSHGKVIVVVSAFGGITDLLHLYAQQAAAQTETYAKTLELISSKTLENLDFWNADSQTREAVFCTAGAKGGQCNHRRPH
mgnify:CR=1 FL=1